MKILPEILLIIVASFDGSLDTLSLSLRKKKEEKEERKEEGNRDKETSKYYIFEIEKATLRASIQFRV